MKQHRMAHSRPWIMSSGKHGFFFFRNRFAHHIADVL
jgi:hypothetical protein